MSGSAVIRWAGAAIAVAITLVPFGAAQARTIASSDSRIATTVVFPQPPFQQIDYSHRQVTIQGTLQTVVPAGQTPQGISGEPVQLTLEAAGGRFAVPLGQVTTDGSGHFSLTSALPVPGLVVPQFAGDSTYAPNSGRTMEYYRNVATLAATDFPAKITVDPITPTTLGSKIAITGEVTMQLPDGTWVPSPFEPVGYTCGPGWTDINGRFSVPVTVSMPSQCVLNTVNGDSWGWSGPAISMVTITLSVHPTAVHAFSATSSYPQPIGNMGFAGDAEYQIEDGYWSSYPNAAAELFCQPAGSKKWLLVAKTTGPVYGVVSFDHISGYLPGGLLGAGGWQLRLPAAPGYQASQSAVYYASVTVPTWLNNVAVKRTGHHALLTGVLDDHHRTGPIASQRVFLYRQASRHSGWQRVAAVKTGATGKFSFTLTGRPSGRYRVTYLGARFAGSLGTYLTSTSRAIRYAG